MSWKRLADNLAELETVPSRVAAEASERIQALIGEQFASGADPYGTAWKRLTDATLAKGRFPPPLTDTGALLDSIEVRPRAGAGINITVGEDYARFHQEGTVNMDARPILPDRPPPSPALSGLPDEWSEAIDNALESAVRRTLRKR